jgi:hypothetical protein
VVSKSFQSQQYNYRWSQNLSRASNIIIGGLKIFSEPAI